MKKQPLATPFLTLTLALTLLLSPLRSSAWWDTGHMAVAQIAYNSLDPGTRAWADGLIVTLATGYPETHNFVEAATWPDDIKGHGITAYSTWHYTNIPLNEDRIKVPCTDTPQINVVWAIATAKSIVGNARTTTLEKAQFLAFLIHFVGDLHQPLHSTSRYTKALPGGDQGGNLFPLGDKEHSNLHKLWDDGCGYFQAYDSVYRPAGPAQWTKTLEKIADAITKAYPQDSIPGVEQLDPGVWAQESHTYAVKYGFKGIQSQGRKGGILLKPNDAPSALYLEAGQKVVEMRIAAGGYRLAKLLNGIHAGLQGK